MAEPRIIHATTSTMEQIHAFYEAMELSRLYPDIQGRLRGFLADVMQLDFIARGRSKVPMGLFEFAQWDDDLRERLYGIAERRSTEISRQVINNSSRVGHMIVYEEAGKRHVFWQSLADGNSCEDCLELHGAVMQKEEFKARYQRTRCGGNCRCTPLPADVNTYDEMEPIENARYAGVEDKEERRAIIERNRTEKKERTVRFLDRAVQ